MDGLDAAYGDPVLEGITALLGERCAASNEASKLARTHTRLVSKWLTTVVDHFFAVGYFAEATGDVACD